MIYVMSDIHGHIERFEDILKQIEFCNNDTLYILGDVIDRFPDGIRILRKIMRSPNMKMLLGNHEYMMLEALVNPSEPIGEFVTKEEVREYKISTWYYNGGAVTHQYLKRIKKDVRAEIYEYLKTLPLNIRIEVNGQKYLLIHAGIADNFDNIKGSKYNNATEYAVWSRNIRSEMVPADTVVVFGHTPTSYFRKISPIKLWKSGKFIGIDCGCGSGSKGRLCCLRLDDMKEFYSEVSSKCSAQDSDI